MGEGIVGIVDEGRRALNLADAVDQPVAVNLQHAGDIREPVNAGARGSPAQDVIDERAVEPRHFCDMGRCQAKLIGAGPQPVGQGVVFGHLFPKGLWIK